MLLKPSASSFHYRVTKISRSLQVTLELLFIASGVVVYCEPDFSGSRSSSRANLRGLEKKVGEELVSSSSSNGLASAPFSPTGFGDGLPDASCAGAWIEVLPELKNIRFVLSVAAGHSVSPNPLGNHESARSRALMGSKGGDAIHLKKKVGGGGGGGGNPSVASRCGSLLLSAFC